MDKSPDAFRTISEVAEWLGLPTHVLRFWESKFSQVRPVKRAGGRRYYRPADMLLLGGIKQLLHVDGLTIKGAQKVLRERGVPHVTALSQPLDDLTLAVLDDNTLESEPQSVDMSTTLPEPMAEELPPVPAPEVSFEQVVSSESSPLPELSQALQDDPIEIESAQANEPIPAPIEEPSAPIPAVEQPPLETPDLNAETEAVTETPQPSEPAPTPVTPLTEPELPEQADVKAEGAAPAEPVETTSENDDSIDTTAAPLTFVRRARTSRPVIPPAPVESAPEPKRARAIEVSLPQPEAEINASPSSLSALSKLKQLSSAQAEALRPHLAQLAAWHARMSADEKEVHKD